MNNGITDEQVKRAVKAWEGGAGWSHELRMKQMRAALEAAQLQAVAIAEDPVREAARRLLDGWVSYEIAATAEGRRLSNALREALAQPAPPSLTEDERKEILYRIENPYKSAAEEHLRDRHGEIDEALESAREKLS